MCESGCTHIFPLKAVKKQDIILTSGDNVPSVYLYCFYYNNDVDWGSNNLRVIDYSADYFHNFYPWNVNKTSKIPRAFEKGNKNQQAEKPYWRAGAYAEAKL